MCPTIDANADFTMDVPGFWENLWDSDLGEITNRNDPDAKSRRLKLYHKILWSRPLPNGERMDLEYDYSSGGYLKWKDIRLSSDSIAVDLKCRCEGLLRSTFSNLDNEYRMMVEEFYHRTYTIGGMILFPKHRNSINQCRGCNQSIMDRWDLTLECIRRFYSEEESPLSWCLEQDRGFFELFVDFKGYVEYFLLQDCVTDDCSKVKMWLDTPLFISYPLPGNKRDYLSWRNCNLEFVSKRNARIEGLVKELNL